MSEPEKVSKMNKYIPTFPLNASKLYDASVFISITNLNYSWPLGLNCETKIPTPADDNNKIGEHVLCQYMVL